MAARDPLDDLLDACHALMQAQTGLVDRLRTGGHDALIIGLRKQVDQLTEAMHRAARCHPTRPHGDPGE